MPITVNGVELCDAEVEQEMLWHQDNDNPLHGAVITRILRRVLLDEAQRVGISIADEEEAVTRLLQTQAASPAPDEAACRRFYDANPQRFMTGACVQADHILFQVTPGVNLQALRLQAEEVLQQVQQVPGQFADLARRYSNCPSAALGGSLGQIIQGSTVPEFERVVFSMEPGGVHPKLVQSRHGLHIVRVTHRVKGRLQPYENVSGDIAQVLTAMGRDTAWRQYVRILVARAKIEGIDLAAGLEADRLTVEGLPA